MYKKRPWEKHFSLDIPKIQRIRGSRGKRWFFDKLVTSLRVLSTYLFFSGYSFQTHESPFRINSTPFQFLRYNANNFFRISVFSMVNLYLPFYPPFPICPVFRNSLWPVFLFPNIVLSFSCLVFHSPNFSFFRPFFHTFSNSSERNGIQWNVSEGNFPFLNKYKFGSTFKVVM